MEQSALHPGRFAADTHSIDRRMDPKPIWKLWTRRNFLPLPGKTSRYLGRQVGSLMTIKTELSRLLYLLVVLFHTKTAFIHAILILCISCNLSKCRVIILPVVRWEKYLLYFFAIFLPNIEHHFFITLVYVQFYFNSDTWYIYQNMQTKTLLPETMLLWRSTYSLQNLLYLALHWNVNKLGNVCTIR
jgi:hypothetical protein